MKKVFVVLALFACGGGDSAKQVQAASGRKDPAQWPANDQGKCVYQGRADVEVSEIASQGALKPNIRRVFRIVGDSEHQHRMIECREADTNLDGIKDVVRTYNPKGEPVHEEVDSDYDGKVDVWINFAEGRIAEVQEDTNHDGRPDLWKFYSDGALNRAKRDRNFDGTADVWEMYSRAGKLERMGVDDNGDGHVDRWDRDDQLVRDAEEADRKVREAMAPPDAGAANDSGWRVE
jgi:hypothetical protein